MQEVAGKFVSYCLYLSLFTLVACGGSRITIDEKDTTDMRLEKIIFKQTGKRVHHEYPGEDKKYAHLGFIIREFGDVKYEGEAVKLLKIIYYQSNMEVIENDTEFKVIFHKIEIPHDNP